VWEPIGLVRALIFDLDGTLVDTVYAHVVTWQRALDEAALPIEAEELRGSLDKLGFMP
jgi:beta-phosphoglucomutase-like phosphatase (HAD superfamily)